MGIVSDLQDEKVLGTSLAAQWLRLCTFTAGDAGSIPGRGTKIPNKHKEKVLNICFTTMNLFKITELYSIVQVVNFMLCGFCHNKKIYIEGKNEQMSKISKKQGENVCIICNRKMVKTPIIKSSCKSTRESIAVQKNNRQRRRSNYKNNYLC